MSIDISKIIPLLPKFFRRHKIVILLLQLFPNSKIQIVHFNSNCKLYADISDSGPRNCLLLEEFEPEFFKIAIPFLAIGGVFFDVGANWGFCSFGIVGYLSKHNIDYHLFEANINICSVLASSSLLYPEKNFYINNGCVSNEKGQSRLNISIQSGESFISDFGNQEVDNLILDEYIQEKQIKKVNLMKIDIEGWEPLALMGASESLYLGIVDAIYTEFISKHLSRVGFSLVDYGKLLESYGFKLFYCKSKDFQCSFGKNIKVFDLNINGYTLKLASLDINNIPAEMYSGIRDILAIHTRSGYLQQYSELLK